MPSDYQKQACKGPVLKAAKLRKLKTLKKKFFVLRGESVGHASCLEYYDSRKKFESNCLPKRSIPLRDCFNIDKRYDTKYKYVIAMYSKDDCFCYILDSERDLEEWLSEMLMLQGGLSTRNEYSEYIFGYAWAVFVQKKGLGESPMIHGPHILQLSNNYITLIRNDTKDKFHQITFFLSSIRRTGYMDRILYIELGRSAISGGGELWIEVHSSNTASDIHQTINKVLSRPNKNKGEDRCRGRTQSLSTNEAKKPNAPKLKKNSDSFNRIRCDSLPTTTAFQGNNQSTQLFLPWTSCAPSMKYSKNQRPDSIDQPYVKYTRSSALPIARFPAKLSAESEPRDKWNLCGETSSFKESRNQICTIESDKTNENVDDYVPWAAGDLHSEDKPRTPLVDAYVQMDKKGQTGDRGLEYIDMSPVFSCQNIPIEGKIFEDYVPMTPINPDDVQTLSERNDIHVPKDSKNSQHDISIVSGTPSTDLRFSAYHLEKIISYLVPGEDLQATRSLRAYSVGSRPDTFCKYRKSARLYEYHDTGRTRAFSVGSRIKKYDVGKLINVITAPLVSESSENTSPKSSSAPVLTSIQSSNHRQRAENLMELDFTRMEMPGPSSLSQTNMSTASTAIPPYGTAIPSNLSIDPLIGTPNSSYANMSGSMINRSNVGADTCLRNRGQSSLGTFMHPHTLSILTTLNDVHDQDESDTTFCRCSHRHSICKPCAKLAESIVSKVAISESPEIQSVSTVQNIYTNMHQKGGAHFITTCVGNLPTLPSVTGKKIVPNACTFDPGSIETKNLEYLHNVSFDVGHENLCAPSKFACHVKKRDMSIHRTHLKATDDPETIQNFEKNTSLHNIHNIIHEDCDVNCDIKSQDDNNIDTHVQGDQMESLHIRKNINRNNENMTVSTHIPSENPMIAKNYSSESNISKNNIFSTKESNNACTRIRDFSTTKELNQLNNQKESLYFDTNASLAHNEDNFYQMFQYQGVDDYDDAGMIDHFEDLGDCYDENDDHYDFFNIIDSQRKSEFQEYRHSDLSDVPHLRTSNVTYSNFLVKIFLSLQKSEFISIIGLVELSNAVFATPPTCPDTKSANVSGDRIRLKPKVNKLKCSYSSPPDYQDKLMKCIIPEESDYLGDFRSSLHEKKNILTKQFMISHMNGFYSQTRNKKHDNSCMNITLYSDPCQKTEKEKLLISSSKEDKDVMSKDLHYVYLDLPIVSSLPVSVSAPPASIYAEIDYLKLEHENKLDE